jgi:hypothetical protein
MLVAAMLAFSRAFAGTAPPGYTAAHAAFVNLNEFQRVQLQIKLTAAGFWPAVPNKGFSERLFDAIASFQRANAFAPTGTLDFAENLRLNAVAEPVLASWGFQAIPHPFRGTPLWVPMGLGLRTERTAAGLRFTDSAGHLRLDFEYYPRPLTLAYTDWMNHVIADGDRVDFSRIKPDFFAIATGNASNRGRYIRFQQDGHGILGFALTFDGNDWPLHGDRLEALVSASLWSAMTPRAPFMPLPDTHRPPPAEQPVVVAAAPVPPVAVPARPPPVAPDYKQVSGSGFFISREGHILTNAHVVDDARAPRSPLRMARWRPASPRGTRRTTWRC